MAGIVGVSPGTRRGGRSSEDLVRALIALVLALSLVGCGGDDGADRADDGTTSTSSSTGSTGSSSTTEPDPLVTMGPSCTAGTVPEGAVPPPGCDRIYTPFLFPGDACTEGQDPDCIDPDRDGELRFILEGGRCLVERKDYDRCRDDDGDGALDEPLTG
jgi:hypothetical protein